MALFERKAIRMEFTIFEQKPSDFESQVEVSAAYIEAEGKFLFLQVSESKNEAMKWGVPAGKKEKHESAENCLCRELFEETGIAIKESEYQSLGSIFITKPSIQYTYHLYKVNFNKTPIVKLSNEHISFKWVAKEELCDLPLMTAALEAFHIHLKRGLI